MATRLARFKGFPLLRKDLMEQAARRRTYVVRLVFALCLLAIFLLQFRQALLHSDRDVRLFLGSGLDIFQLLSGTMMVAIYALVPAMVAGAFPAERERGTLELLWITELRPTEILLQSYSGRLVTVLTLLLVSVPLLALSYVLGGVTEARIVNTVYYLFLATFQLSAIAIFFSAVSRTPLRAILGAYVTLLVLNTILPLLLWKLFDEPWLFSPIGFYFTDTYKTMISSVLGSTYENLNVLIPTLPSLVSGVLFVVMARIVLGREFATRARSRSWFPDGGERQARIRSRFRSQTRIQGLPDREPVAWREARPLLTGRLARVGLWLAVAAELVVIGLVVHDAMVNPGKFSRRSELLHTCSIILFINWTVAVLATTLRAASAFPAERGRQNLQVLLTTPLSSRELVRQKWKGIRHGLILPALVLLMFVLLRTFALLLDPPDQEYSWLFDELTWSPYLAIGVLSILIYLQLTAFFSLWIGLRSRTTIRAVLSALFLIVAGIAVPFLLLAAIQPDNMICMVLSPAAILLFSELGHAPDGVEIGWFIFANFTLYGLWLWLFRFLCLKRADVFLKRVAVRGEVEGRAGSRDQLKRMDDQVPSPGLDPEADPDPE